MNTSTKNIINRVASVTGLILGAFALSAVAAWNPAPATPPNNNTAAPLNVGDIHQDKVGSITVDTNTVNPDMYGLDVFGISRFFGNVEIGTIATPKTIKIVDGNQLNGRVLTSAADGTAHWADAGSGGGGTTGSVPSNLQTFTTSSSWTAPAGVTRVRVRAWGGGGGGAAYNSASVPEQVGGGGGGGGYVEAIVPVTPGASYTVTVGSGGAGGAAGTGDPTKRCGADGGSTSFGGTLVVALGGKKGHSGCGDGESQNGGFGGSYTVGAGSLGFGIEGGDGQKGTSGQSEGGNSPMGGTGSSAWKLSPANQPGGGGGGGVSDASMTSGFSGARGKVVIEY